MLFHYQAYFRAPDVGHHGQVDLPKATPAMVKGNEKKLVEVLKRQLVRDCQRWGERPEGLTAFRAYYHVDNFSEVCFFRWPNADSPVLPSHTYQHGDFKPHKYQLKTIDFLQPTNHAILAIEMGLGKTISCLLYILNINPQSLLIIAPKRVAENVWLQEAEKWGLPFASKMVVVAGTPKKRAELLSDDSRPYKIIGRDNFKDYEGYKCDLLIVDELTTAKNVDAKRTQAIISVRARKKIGLTGTFTANSLVDIFGQIRAVGLFNNNSINFYAWRATYFDNVMKNSGQRFEKWELKKGVTLETLLAPVRKHIFTLAAEDWLAMPEATYTTHPVKLAEAEYNEYMRLATMLQINLNGDVFAIKEQAKQAKLQTACNGFIYDKEGTPHRAAHSSKLEQVAEFVASAVAEGEKVLIFYAFKEEAIWLAELLKKEGVTFVSPNAPDFIARFEKDVDCLIGHPASIGHGIDRLQQFCRVVVWSTLTWSLDLFLQANARIVRQGQKRNVSVNIFAAKDTVEAKVAQALTKKEGTHNDFVNLTKTVDDER